MEIIARYYSKMDLKKRIVAQYLVGIQRRKEGLKRILDDKEWASTDSDYHRECRAQLSLELSEVDKQYEMLKEYAGEWTIQNAKKY